MAINPLTQFPGQIDTTDPAYPYGKAQDISVPGDNTGTPWVKQNLNDVYGFQQALLSAASIVPSGSADKVGASQYLTALQTLFEPVFSKNTAFNLDFGLTTADIAEIGATLVALKIVETDAAGKLITVNKNTGYNLAIGTTPGTVAAGDDSRFNASGQLISETIIQGSVEDELATTPGYIDTSDVAENNVLHNGIISYSINGAAAATSANWSSIFPIVKPALANKTVIKFRAFKVGATANEEDTADGVIIVDWANARVMGWVMFTAGTGYANQDCYRLSGAIGAGANDYTGTLQNGSFVGGAAVPTFRVDGTLLEIQRLPMLGRCRNVGFDIKHFS